MALFGSYAKAVIVGNIVRDVEMRTLPSGTQIAEVAVAVNDRIKKGNDWVDQVSYMDCTAFGKTAELIQRFGGKGRAVLLDCSIRQDRWQDKSSGQNRSKIAFIVDNVTFMSDGKGGGGGSGGS
ncbi:MAG: single-stranded DNA-binding protein, partial [Planctomycetes bacterium]|nr:single-stranded DNA-binding protein [Planctomycetota bacterium]